MSFPWPLVLSLFTLYLSPIWLAEALNPKPYTALATRHTDSTQWDRCNRCMPLTCVVQVFAALHAFLTLFAAAKGVPAAAAEDLFIRLQREVLPS